MKLISAVACVAACAVFAPALAETAPAAPAGPAPFAAPSTIAPVIATPRLVASAGSALPANTEIWLSANNEVNSKRIKQGEKFEMTVARDVMLGDYIVIPRGTRGRGQITYRTGKGAFGKSAKMEFEINEVQLGDRFIPLTGHYRIEGQGNTGATVGAVVAVGVFSAFVTGRSAIVAQGVEYKAFTVNPVPIALAVPAAEAAASKSFAPPATGASPAVPAVAPTTPAEVIKTSATTTPAP